MKTITQNIVGQQTLANLFRKPIANDAVINEERDGYGLLLTNHHVTEIKDQEVRRTIKLMSVMEIIN